MKCWDIYSEVSHTSVLHLCIAIVSVTFIWISFSSVDILVYKQRGDFH